MTSAKEFGGPFFRQAGITSACGTASCLPKRLLCFLIRHTWKERIISEYISRGTFEKEPWKSRIMEDLDEDYMSPESNYPVYPLYNDVFSIAHVLYFSIFLHDSQEAVEELLDGMQSFPVEEDFHGESIECTMYALPLGYFRYTPVVTIRYESGAVYSTIWPSWFGNIMT